MSLSYIFLLKVKVTKCVELHGNKCRNLIKELEKDLFFNEYDQRHHLQNHFIKRKGTPSHHVPGNESNNCVKRFFFDPINLAATFFNGITSFLNMGGIAEARGAIKNLAKNQKQMLDFAVKFANQTSLFISHLEQQMGENFNLLAASMTDIALLTLVNEGLQVIVYAITPLIQGIVPTAALSPQEA